MRFLVDECAGPTVASWLREQSHEVFSVYEQVRGATDDEILSRAASEGWVLVTCDKDFGEKVFREKLPHHGVVFLRLKDERSGSKVAAIEKLLDDYADRLAEAFVVVTETQVRFGKT